MRLEDLKGQRLGRYEVIDLLGRGGMAAVYRARDTTLQRELALKVLYPQYTADPALALRFQREAITAARLDHPNVVPVYDVGETDGLAFIAMKLLSGRTLADLLRERQRLSVAEFAPILQQIADALDYAHERGVIHRDIKPGNILLEPRNQAILSDFGIAKSLDSPGMTNTSALVGTPDYMAPEQINNRQVDHRADIYALGILTYRSLTGRRPFDGTTEEVLLGHLQGSFRPPTEIVPELPPALNPIMERVLARNPDQRYPSAGAFADAIQSLLPIIITPDPAQAAATSVPPRSSPEAVTARMPRPDAKTAQGDARPPEQLRLAPAVQAATPSALEGLATNTAAASTHPLRPPMQRATYFIVGAILLVALSSVLVAQGFFGGVAPSPTNIPTSIVVLPSETPTTPQIATATASATATANPSATPTATVEPTPEPTGIPPTGIPPTGIPPTVAPTTRPPTAVPPTGIPPTTVPTTVVPTTAVPTTAVPTTALPTNTLVPTNTPTPTPEPTPCPVPMQGGFAEIWFNNGSVSQTLGCPTTREQGGEETTVEQAFERGSMHYFAPRGLHFIFIGSGSGTWRVYTQDEVDAMPEATPEPGTPEEMLVGGFLKIWKHEKTVRDGIGKPTEPISGWVASAYQRFVGGSMYFSNTSVGNGPQIYVLANNGTFTRYADPNR
jgi:serine/threonine-protein kinase